MTRACRAAASSARRVARRRRAARLWPRRRRRARCSGGSSTPRARGRRAAACRARPRPTVARRSSSKLHPAPTGTGAMATSASGPSEVSRPPHAHRYALGSVGSRRRPSASRWWMTERKSIGCASSSTRYSCSSPMTRRSSALRSGSGSPALRRGTSAYSVSSSSSSSASRLPPTKPPTTGGEHVTAGVQRRVLGAIQGVADADRRREPCGGARCRVRDALHALLSRGGRSRCVAETEVRRHATCWRDRFDIALLTHSPAFVFGSPSPHPATAVHHTPSPVANRRRSRAEQHHRGVRVGLLPAGVTLEHDRVRPGWSVDGGPIVVVNGPISPFAPAIAVPVATAVFDPRGRSSTPSCASKAVPCPETVISDVTGSCGCGVSTTIWSAFAPVTHPAPADDGERSTRVRALPRGRSERPRRWP